MQHTKQIFEETPLRQAMNITKHLKKQKKLDNVAQAAYFQWKSSLSSYEHDKNNDRNFLPVWMESTS